MNYSVLTSIFNTEKAIPRHILWNLGEGKKIFLMVQEVNQICKLQAQWKDGMFIKVLHVINQMFSCEMKSEFQIAYLPTAVSARRFGKLWLAVNHFINKCNSIFLSMRRQRHQMSVARRAMNNTSPNFNGNNAIFTRIINSLSCECMPAKQSFVFASNPSG